MKKLVVTMLIASIFSVANADINQAVDNFFSSITADTNVDVNNPTMVQNQSAGVISGGGFSTRSQVVNLQPLSYTPPSFNASCGNINFYSGSLAFMTNTDQLIQFLQNSLMTAGVTAVMTALKAVTPNIAGTLQSMMDAAQKMLGMFNNSCQLGMAAGNWMTDRLGKAKAQSHSDSSDASSAEINSTTGGSSGSDLTNKMNEISNAYHSWVSNNANLNSTTDNGIVTDIAAHYGSVIWKGMQALHLYSLPLNSGSTSDVAGVANLVISLVGDVIIYPPNNDGTGTAARTIPPIITDVEAFMTQYKGDISVYNCTYFNTTTPGECNGGNVDLSTLDYSSTQTQYHGGVVKKIQTAVADIQAHFVSGQALNNDDLMIIAISPVPIFAVAQTLDDIGMSGSIATILNKYSAQIAYEVLQKLINVSLNLAVQATTTRNNPETDKVITGFMSTITKLQDNVNSQSSKYINSDSDPIILIQQLNYLKGYAQNQVSPQILQKVNFAKQLTNY